MHVEDKSKAFMKIVKKPQLKSLELEGSEGNQVCVALGARFLFTLFASFAGWFHRIHCGARGIVRASPQAEEELGGPE